MQKNVTIRGLLDECIRVTHSQSPPLVSIEFKQRETARETIELLNRLLPLIGGEYPQTNDNAVILTDDQYHFLKLCAMQETGNLSPEFLGDQYLLKTLRADEGDFSHAFILGIIPGEDGARYQNLRPKARSAFTISPKGHITGRLNKKPIHKPEQKKGFSQIQSCTFVFNEIWSPAFGFSKVRNPKLYGLMTHLGDALISRMLIKDSGTIGRIYDQSSAEAAKQSKFFQKVEGKPTFYSPDKMKEFKEHYRATRESMSEATVMAPPTFATKGFVAPSLMEHNEVLARLRFNPYRSFVSICADSLDARLLAYHFAEEILQEFSLFAKRNGLTLNPNFRVPVIFYLPNNFLFYTPAMRRKDQAEASKLYNSEYSRSGQFYSFIETVHGPIDSYNYDFLLGLTDLSPAHFFHTPNPHTKSSLMHDMLKNGYARIALRLLGPFRPNDANNLCNIVVKKLLDDNLFHRNSPLIAELIYAEAFDLADEIIRDTKSEKDNLYFRGKLLVDHLIDRGNPRQLNYMGLDNLLKKAAAIKNWFTVRLCIKEYPTLRRSILGELLFEACQQRQHPEADFLLRMGAETGTVVNAKTPIVCATELEDWLMVGLFSQYPTDVMDTAHYGYALLGALRHEQRGLAKLLLQAGAKPTWRTLKQERELESTVFYALMHDYQELLPPLIKHEKYSETTSPYFYNRLLLTRDLAQIKGNEKTAGLIEDFMGTASKPHFQHIEKNWCYFALEAMFIGNAWIDLQRLEKYWRLENKVARGANNNLSGPEVYDLSHRHNFSEAFIENALRIIRDHFSAVMEYFPYPADRKVLDALVTLAIAFEDRVLFQRVCTSRYLSIGTVDHPANLSYPGSRVFSSILANLQDDNIAFIRELRNIILKKQDSHTVIQWENTLEEALEESLRKGINEKTFALMKLRATSNFSCEETSQCIQKILCKDYDELNDDLLLKLCLEIKKKVNYQVTHLEALSQLWSYHSVFSERLLKEFISLFGSTTIRHLALHALFRCIEHPIIRNNHTIQTIVKPMTMKKRKSRDDRVGQMPMIHSRSSIKINRLESYPIIRCLENYFSTAESAPLPEITLKVYNKIVREFQSFISVSKDLKASKNISFFAANESLQSYTVEMCEYLQSVDQHIVKYAREQSSAVASADGQLFDESPRCHSPSDFESYWSESAHLDYE
jgi:hypothetical protein